MSTKNSAGEPAARPRGFLGRCMVEANEPQGRGAWLMRLAIPSAGFAPQAGQFVTLRVGEGTDPLLRRPFSVCNASFRPEGNSTGIEILYKVVGRGTKLLARLKPADTVNLMGPLGHGFSLPKRKSVCVLVAGGIGVAPLVLLARQLVKLPFVDDRRRVVVLIGAKTRDELYCADELSDYGITLKVATEDGSAGLRGTVLDLLAKAVRVLRPVARKKRHSKRPAPVPKSERAGLAMFAGERVNFYACGPVEMLKKVGKLAARHNFPCEVSLEQRMACGVGACRGCVIQVAGRKKGQTAYATACQGGPVFEWRKVARLSRE